MSDNEMCPKCGRLTVSIGCYWCSTPAPPPQPEMPESRDYRLGQMCQSLGILPLDLGSLLVRYDLTIVGPAERAVLDACSTMTLGDDDPDEDPLEPQEVGEDCYIYTDDQARIARAELALRAAKACPNNPCDPECPDHG